MRVRPAEEESDAVVRRVDQDNINTFARLNTRLHELRDEREVIKVSAQGMKSAYFFMNIFALCFQSLSFSLSLSSKNKKSLERLDDASTELMMGSGDSVLLMIGESFFDTTEDDATEYCEEEVERLQGLLESFEEEESSILEQQAELKKTLYGRFGKSIQLEDS